MQFNIFTVDEAVQLLNSHVVKKGDEQKSKTTTSVIGFVAGVLTLNDEIEVLVKFSDGTKQFTKDSFYEEMTLLEMP